MARKASNLWLLLLFAGAIDASGLLGFQPRREMRMLPASTLCIVFPLGLRCPTLRGGGEEAEAEGVAAAAAAAAAEVTGEEAAKKDEEDYILSLDIGTFS
jgi:hypothetical protein